MKRYLITGSRATTNRQLIHDKLRHHFGFLTLWSQAAQLEYCRIMHGACETGADAIADELLREWNLGILIETYPAEWDRLGKAAGPIRNTKMIAQCFCGDEVIAFPGSGPGTRQCLRAAINKGLIIHSYPV